MKKLFIISLFLLLAGGFGCTKEKDCTCDDISGKYYLNVQNNYFTNPCAFVDDMEFTNNGYVNLYRTGGQYSQEKMSKIFKYEFTKNCQVRLYDFNKSVLLPDPKDCFGISVVFNFDAGEQESIIPLTLIECNSFNIGMLTWLNYDPR